MEIMEIIACRWFCWSRPSGSVQDVSMIDWDVTVQQDLRNVEEILERADGILAVR